MTVERLDLDLKALRAGDAGEIEGLAWPFGSPDRVGDVIGPEAFAGVRSPLPMLDAHDPSRPIGVWESFAVTARGLVAKGRLLVAEVARAAELHALVKAGGVRGLSIGFATKASTPRPGGGRTITALDLVEISLVAIPCHPGARVTAAKAASQEEGPMGEDQTEAPEAETTDADRLAAAETKAAELETRLAEQAERLAAVERKAARPGAPALIPSADERAEIERKAFAAYLRHGNAAPEAKVLAVSSASTGGVLAPRELAADIIRDLAEFSPIRGLATVRSISAPGIDLPKRIGRTNSAWATAENVDSTGSEPSFGVVTIDAKELTTFVDISNRLLEDAPAALAEVRAALAEDFGMKEAAAFISGAGTIDPEGLTVAAGVTSRPTGHASTLGSDPAGLLVDLLYSLPATYRAKSTWLMNGSTLAALRKLKDTTGAFIWQAGLAAGQPETILGRPVVECVDLPDVGAGAIPIVLGDIATAYRIADRADLSVLVDPYSRAVARITRIHASRRVGGRVVQPAALRKIRIAAS